MAPRVIDNVEAMSTYQIKDTQRRISNILDSHPRDSWTLEESQAVLAALSGIVRVRQGAGDVGLRVSVELVALGEAPGELAEDLVVWQISRRSDDFDDSGYLGGLQVASGD